MIDTEQITLKKCPICGNDMHIYRGGGYYDEFYGLDCPCGLHVGI